MKLNCKDELVELLNNHGYNLVLLPRENIVPLQMLIRKNKGTWARVKDVFATPRLEDTNATVSEVFMPDSNPLPVPTTGDVVNDVKGKRSSSLSAEAAAELMINLLQLTGKDDAKAQKLKLEAALKSAKQVSFAFGEEATSTSVSIAGLDAYLKDAELLDTVGHTFREWVDNDQVYIITDVLSATSFSMKGSNETDASANINVPVIQEIVDGKINGKLEVFEQSGLKYHGAKPLVFGFKAVRLLSEENNGRTIYKIATQDGLLLKGDEDIPVEQLPNEGRNFLDIH